MDLEVQISWQARPFVAQRFVDLELQISWHGRRFVDLAVQIPS